MKLLQPMLVAALLGVVGSQAQAQTVLDFETFPSCDNSTGNVGLYGGVNFFNQWTCYNSYQPPYNPASGSNRVYTYGNGPTSSFGFAGPVNFVGAWFSGYSFATVQFLLFNGATQVATSSLLAPSDVPTFLASGYSGGVTSVQVVTGGADYYVMDDVTFTRLGSTTTPEPATLVLLASGIAGVAVMRLRGRQKA